MSQDDMDRATSAVTATITAMVPSADGRLVKEVAEGAVSKYHMVSCGLTFADKTDESVKKQITDTLHTDAATTDAIMAVAKGLCGVGVPAPAAPVATTTTVSVTGCAKKKGEKGQYQIGEEVMDEFFAEHSPIKDVVHAANLLRERLNLEYELQNSIRNGRNKFRSVDVLPERATARLLAETKRIALFQIYNDKVDAELGIYATSGSDEGTWQCIANPDKDDSAIKDMIYMIHPNADAKYIKNVFAKLRAIVPFRKPTDNYKKYVPVENGVWFRQEKVLRGWNDPEVKKLTFLNKIRTKYNPNASMSPRIVNPDGSIWQVDSWIASLFADGPDKDGKINTLWEMIYMCVIPNTPCNKTGWICNEEGNNGKGTLSMLICSLLGEINYTSIKLEDFDRDFATQNLAHKIVIINDDSNDEIFIDKESNLKNIITGDNVPVNRKFLPPTTLRWNGFMLQMLNKEPKVKNKNKNFLRRLMFLFMDKCFEGIENKAIKNDYVKRKEVLEYVLYKILHMPVLEGFTETDASRNALENYRAKNDAVYDFMNIFDTEFIWNFVPFKFLYDLYTAYSKDTHFNADRTVGESYNTFVDRVKSWVSASPRWQIEYETDDKGKTAVKKTTIGNMMSEPEPLILEYDLKNWMNSAYTGPSPEKRCIPSIRNNTRATRGIIRITTTE